MRLLLLGLLNRGLAGCCDRLLNRGLLSLDDRVLAVETTSEENSLIGRLGLAIFFEIVFLDIFFSFLNTVLFQDLLHVAVVDRLVRIFVLKAEPSFVEVCSVLLHVMHANCE